MTENDGQTPPWQLFQDEILYKGQELQRIIDALPQQMVVIDGGFRTVRANIRALRNSSKNSFVDFIRTSCHRTLYQERSICPFCPFRSNRPHRAADSPLPVFPDIFPEKAADSDQSGSAPKMIEKTVVFGAGQPEEKILRLQFVPLKREGRIYSILEIIEDITRERQAEKERNQSMKLKLLGQMVSGIAHEINNPLTGMAFTLQLLEKNHQRLLENLRNEQPAEQFHEAAREQKRGLELIKMDLQKADHIIQDVLSFSRSKKTVSLPGDIGRIVERALEDCRVYFPRIYRQTKIVIRRPRKPVLARVNPQKFQRVFLNIFHNALQALEKTFHPRLRVTIGSKEDLVRVVIQDNGPGIPPENLDKVFDPFFTTKAMGQGTGLGLSLCLGILKEHGGDIFLSSRPGRTRFIIQFPTGNVETVSEPAGS